MATELDYTYVMEYLYLNKATINQSVTESITNNQPALNKIKIGNYNNR